MHNLQSVGGKQITHHLHHEYYISAGNQMHITQPQKEERHLLRLPTLKTLAFIC